MNYIPGIKKPGLSFDPALIHFGQNSGFQAINLAVNFGAKRLILLGYDMKPADDGHRHWFGDHPPGLHRGIPFADFIAAFNEAAPDIARAGIEIINCSRDSALDCFDKRDLRDVL